MKRRQFLVNSSVVGLSALAHPFMGYVSAQTQGVKRASGFGALTAVKDLADGEVRLFLPAGFEYRSFGVVGEVMSDGAKTPGKHDGMGAFAGPNGNTILIRNHEINGPVGAFGDVTKAYDSAAGGGTVTLEVTARGEVVSSRMSLNGTQMNCAGGVMPWGAWLTGEETVNGPDVGNDYTKADNSKLTQKHGYLFEVPLNGAPSGPIRAAGRFAHEAAVFDPVNEVIYMTEDNFNFASGFYRYLPPTKPTKNGKLADGGKLQMLAIRGQPNKNLALGQPKNATFAVTWVDIDVPDPTFAAGTSNDIAIQHVGAQGRWKGAAWFSRLEGAVYHAGSVYFVSTQGGATPKEGPSAEGGFGKGRGQVWQYHIAKQTLKLVYESSSEALLDMPDNIAVSPRGSLILCEDGSGENFLRALTPRAGLVDIARLAPVAGDAGAEFAGATFSPDGNTLFVNVQSRQGRSFAIWGPWRTGGV
ncbi:MAG: DUF839 domain-containing protein [Burkholderiales bacterium]|nr:DUF839 domain-containing protein [Burkholderiales bacterium]